MSVDPDLAVVDRVQYDVLGPLEDDIVGEITSFYGGDVTICGDDGGGMPSIGMRSWRS